MSELALKRIRAVSEKAVAKRKANNVDLGFRWLLLQASNFKQWQNYDGTEHSQLEALFDQFESPLVKGWQRENLFTEILLIEGFPLDSQIEKRSMGSGAANTLRVVSSDFCEHKLLVCLDEQIGEASIQQLQLGENDIFICLDSAIGDEDKVCMSDKGLLKTI